MHFITIYLLSFSNKVFLKIKSLKKNYYLTIKLITFQSTTLIGNMKIEKILF